MKTSTASLRRSVLHSLGALALALAPATHATIAPLQPLADQKAQALPLTHTIAKGTPGENGGPFAVTFKNTSNAALKVSGQIVWSVASHNRANTIALPERTLEAGGTWTVNDLAVEDRVILSAPGYEKLEVKVPPAKMDRS